MFQFFSKKLTEYTHHYIDWSRIGNLVQSKNHRYSRQEMITRGGIITFTALAAIVALYANDEQQTSFSNGSMAILAGIAGFTLSHSVVVYPLIRKRCSMDYGCQSLIKKIQTQTNFLAPSTKEIIQALVGAIMKLSLSDNVHGNASQTWGHRKRLLSLVNQKLTPFNSFDWQYDVKSLLGQLENDLRNSHSHTTRLTK